MPAYLSGDQLARDLSIRDLTDPEAGPHAMQLILRDAVDAVARHWECDVRWWRGERIVSVTDNYDNLGYRTDDVTRDARYTRYVDDHRMLRSHSTAGIPGALRALADDPAGDVLLVCPGIVYRRDSIDRLHTGTPHQLDLWRVTRRPVPMGTADLDEMIAVLIDVVLPGAQHRHEARVHPYTEHGRQVDVARTGEWVEIAECGLAAPHVLQRAGLDHTYSGLALGMGLDRMLMLRKGITDIRLLRSTNPAVAEQLTDLTPYRPVSAMPAIRRDLSVAVDRDDRAEDLGDRVRDALGPDADQVESVEIRTRTPCSQLPPQALRRLGARPDQQNVLLAVVLRHLTRTLTDHEANQLRDRIYAAVHQGAAHQWATTS
ncbi:hypothetical protein [Nocardia sp. NPDC127526]|uniref:PheS-related mystery ligase SrmL n=1 Tax=Nocardia sp. NPDC127526 TaxID=3345393 RepID=UPI00362A9E1F